jgi:UDP-sugar pyrophosphorylase
MSEVLSVETLSAEPYGQAHLFEGLGEADRAGIVAQLQTLDGKLPGGGLKGYISRARSLLADSKAGTNPFAGLVPTVPQGERLSGDTGPGSTQYAELEDVGAAQLAKCAFCLVAGGLGERLGFPGIKISITAEVTTGASFMEIYASHILSFQAHARTATGSADLCLPLAIMTSGDTHDQTVELLEKNSFFGLKREQVTLMRQEKVPALIDVDARLACKDGLLETKPHGHGDVHSLLLQHGLTKQWMSEGREWLVVFQDTNPLPFRSLCAILGVSVRNGFVLNSVAVPRLPKEAIGGVAKLEDAAKGTSLTINVEYNQLDPLLRETPVGGDVADASGFSPYPGNINILVFKIPEFDRCLQTTGGIVPEFVNPKWADAEKTKFKSPTRLECMMQDFPRLCGPDDKVGFTQLDRGMCFTCVKNNLADAATKKPPDCALSAEADIYACSAQLLRAAGDDVDIEAPDTVEFLGISAQIGARIILKPEFAISLNDMKKKIKGKIRISKRSTLILHQNATIDGLELDGALELRSPVKDAAVKNDGCPLVAIPEADLPSQPPSLKIRGYTLSDSPIPTM